MGVFYSSCIEDDNCLWLLASDFSMLCKMDKDSRDISVFEIFTDTPFKARGSYGLIKKIRNYIYAFPHTGNDILKINIESHAVYRIPITFNEKYIDLFGKVMSCYVSDEYIYCVGGRIPLVIKLNIGDDNYEIIEIDTSKFFWKTGCLSNNKIYLPFSPLDNSDSKMMLVDLTNKSYSVIKIDGWNYDIGIVNSVDKNKLFVWSRDASRSALIDINKMKVNNVFEIKNSLNQDFFYPSCIEQNGIYWFFPKKGRLILGLKYTDDKKNIKDVIYINSDYQYLHMGIWDKNHLFGISENCGEIVILETNNRSLESIKMRFPKGMKDLFEKKLNFKSVIIEQKRTLDLDIFIGMIS